MDNKSLFLILAGSITWSLTMVKSGLLYGFGMGFWGPNGHDGVWHISLIKQLAQGGWQIPVFAGETIKNYHIGYDLLVAFVHKLTTIPIHTLYFQILPPITAVLVGHFCYRFVYIWRKSKKQAFWATFFVYFGGSFGWIVTLFREASIGGESMFWAQQSISTLINPPFALSLILIFAGLEALMKGIKNKDKKYLTAATFLFGVLVQIKIYAAILCLGALFVIGLVRIIRTRRVDVIKVFTGALVVTVLLFPSLSQGAGNIVFKPFWFLETMMANTDRLYWPRFAGAMQNYVLGGVWLKAALAYIVAFFIFWYGNMGTRLLSEIYWAKKIVSKGKFGKVEMFVALVIVAGVAIPMFFVQSGTAWNSIQFFYYSLVFSGILAGIYTAELVEKSRFGLVVGAAVVLFTIPTTYGTLKHYLPERPPAKISNDELAALKYLSDQPDGTVLTLPFDKDKAKEAVDNPPRPLYLYESTAYISAFSGKQVYLEDEVNLEITGYDWRQRRNRVLDELASDNKIAEFMRDNNILYLYLTKPVAEDFRINTKGLIEVFDNPEIVIYSLSVSS